MRACTNAGIDRLWMLASIRRDSLGEQKGVGPATMRLADDLLRATGCTFDMFPGLREAMEEIAAICRKRSRLPRLTSFECYMALAGSGDWARLPVIIGALAEYGLRPGMPLEELFVYDPSLAAPVEPKELTVAEEVAAFLSAKIADLRSDQLPAEPLSIIGAETTVGECAFIVAIARMQSFQHVSGLDACTHMLNKLARQHLSPEALERLGM